MSFGEKLAKLRKDKGYSQEELADKLNVSRQAVSKWESNNAYPETEKIISICKLFNTSMDELIGLKNSSNKADKFTYYLNYYVELFVKGIKMFYSMAFIQKIKCLIEMVFYLGFMLLLVVIFHCLIRFIIANLLSILPWEITNFLLNILNGILYIFYTIIIVIILCKLYKIRYLDYYEEVISKPLTIEEVHCSPSIKEEKIIIRDAKNSFNPFSFIHKIWKWMAKVFISFITLPFVITFIIILASIIFILYFINNSIILLYILLCLFGALLLNYLIIEILFKYIFSLKLNMKKIFAMFIMSLLILSISIGLVGGELSSYKVVKPNYILDSSKNIVMQDNLILDYLDYYNIEVILEDRDNIKIEYYKSNKFINIKQYSYSMELNNNLYNIDYFGQSINISNYSLNDFIKELLSHLKNKEFVLDDGEVKIVIHLNKDNYQKLKNNLQMYYERYYGEE